VGTVCVVLAGRDAELATITVLLAAARGGAGGAMVLRAVQVTDRFAMFGPDSREIRAENGKSVRRGTPAMARLRSPARARRRGGRHATLGAARLRRP
jgi:hypothetical protein